MGGVGVSVVWLVSGVSGVSGVVSFSGLVGVSSCLLFASSSSETSFWTASIWFSGMFGSRTM